MDSGKTTVKISTDVLPVEAIVAVADQISVALQRARLGTVVPHAEVAYEPFTPACPEFGRRWHEIVLDLEIDVASQRVVALLVAAGVPLSSHITYTDRMQVCGGTLGRL